MHLISRALALACAMAAIGGAAAFAQQTLPIAQTPLGNKVVATPVLIMPPTASGVTVVTASLSAPGNTAALPAVAGRPINVKITGAATGLSARLTRSDDDGATWQPLTIANQPWAVYTGNVLEQAWVETEAPTGHPILFRVEVTAIAAGTAGIRLSQ